MVTYVCDGSEKNGILGAGIVKEKQKNVETFHFTTHDTQTTKHHEYFALMKTFKLIEEKNEKQVLIYNDDRGLIRMINRKRKKPSMPLTQKLGNIVEQLYQRIQELEQKGYTLTLTSTIKPNNKSIYTYHQQAHNLSRAYLNKK